MSTASIAIGCGRCGAPLALPLAAGEVLTDCQKCGGSTRGWAFPALVREDTPCHSGGTVVADESTCFYHAGKPAKVVCEGCGRFLCALCDTGYRGRHVCASCVEAGRAEAGGDGFRSRYTHYDTVALTVAVLPVILPFFWFLSIFTAPVAVFLAIYFWREPMSALPRARWRALLAIALGALQLALWAGLAGTLFTGIFNA